MITEKEKYIENNFKNWKEKYQFDDYLDFQVKTLFKLQYEFEELDSSHSKSQYDKLQMINQIMKYLTYEHKLFSTKK